MRARETLLGQRVALEQDVSERDRYDRLLRYVYIADGTFWNGLMVSEGFAWAGCWPPDCSYYAYLQERETQARTEGLGGWGECGWEVESSGY